MVPGGREARSGRPGFEPVFDLSLCVLFPVLACVPLGALAYLFI
jgi:hypothetical protein